MPTHLDNLIRKAREEANILTEEARILQQISDDHARTAHERAWKATERLRELTERLEESPRGGKGTVKKTQRDAFPVASGLPTLNLNSFGFSRPSRLQQNRVQGRFVTATPTMAKDGGAVDAPMAQPSPCLAGHPPGRQPQGHERSHRRASATPLTYSLRRDDGDFVVFCFAKPEDAEAFAKRFGGEHLPVTR